MAASDQYPSYFYNYLNQHNISPSTIDQADIPRLLAAAQQQAQTPLFGTDPSAGTFGDMWAHAGDPNYGINGTGAFGRFSAQDLGQGAMFPGFGQALGTIIPMAATAFNPFVGAGFAALQGASHGGGLGAALGSGALSLAGNLGGSFLSGAAGAIPGSLLDYGIQAGTGAAVGAGGSPLTGGNPLFNAIKGAGGGAFNAYGGVNQLGNDLGISGPTGAANINMSPDTYGDWPSASNTSGSRTASLPLMSGTSNASSSGGFWDNINPFSSSPSNSNLSGGDNLSGMSASPSIFDQAGSYIANNPLTTAAGLTLAGSGLASAMSGGGESSPSSDLGTSLSSFTPQQQPGLAAPNSLANYTNSALSPDQTLSGIATQGVYGRGNGPEEQKYFLNLINNRLVDPMGHVANDMGGINPIENSYLSQLGLGGYQNPTDLLKGISNYAA